MGAGPEPCATRPDVWAPERAGHAAAEQPAELCRPVEAELCDIQPTQDLSVSTASPGISSNVSPVTACAVPSALALASLSPFRATAASLPSPTEDSATSYGGENDSGSSYR